MGIRFGNDKTKADFDRGDFGCFMVGTDSHGRIAIAFRWRLDGVSPYFGPDFDCNSGGNLQDMRALARFIADRRGLKRVTWTRNLKNIKADLLVIDVQNDFARVMGAILSA